MEGELWVAGRPGVGAEWRCQQPAGLPRAGLRTAWAAAAGLAGARRRSLARGALELYVMTLGAGKGKDGGKLGGGTGTMTRHSCIFIWKLWRKCSWLDLYSVFRRGKASPLTIPSPFT